MPYARRFPEGRAAGPVESAEIGTGYGESCIGCRPDPSAARIAVGRPARRWVSPAAKVLSGNVAAESWHPYARQNAAVRPDALDTALAMQGRGN